MKNQTINKTNIDLNQIYVEGRSVKHLELQVKKNFIYKNFYYNHIKHIKTYYNIDLSNSDFIESLISPRQYQTNNITTKTEIRSRLIIRSLSPPKESKDGA